MKLFVFGKPPVAQLFKYDPTNNGVLWDVTPCGSCMNQRFIVAVGVVVVVVVVVTAAVSGNETTEGTSEYSI
jgi:hypothetical protein